MAVYVEYVDINCPPGLEDIKKISQIVIKQKVNIQEVLFKIEACNKYQILNDIDREIFTAKEVSGGCMGFLCRQFARSRRSFDIIISDLQDREIMAIRRKFSLCSRQTVTVEAPVNTPIGYVQQLCSFCKPRFDIRNADNENVLKIIGPIFTSECLGNVNFKIYPATGSDHLGTVSKKRSNMIKQKFTKADDFGVDFPKDLDVKCKATLIGACFLIDFMYFEK